MKTQEATLNGVDVSRLHDTVDAIAKEPELAKFKFRARNRWQQGPQNEATIDSFYGAKQEHQHQSPFRLKADEPPVLLGADAGPNPVETILAGLSGCMTTTLAYHAASRGYQLEAVSSEYEGDIDLRGLLDLDPEVRKGYRQIRVKFRVKGDIDEATIKELVQKSPVLDTLRNPVELQIEVVKE